MFLCNFFGTRTEVRAESGKEVAIAGTKAGSKECFGTRTSVRAESGKKVAIAGTEVPVPKSISEPRLQSGLRVARK